MTSMEDFIRNLGKEDYEKEDSVLQHLNKRIEAERQSDPELDRLTKIEEDKLEYDDVVSQLKAISWQLKRIADALNKWLHV